MVERLFLAVPSGCLQFVIVVFPDHTHLLFLVMEADIMKKVSEYDEKIDNHILQTNPWHREQEPHNNYETLRRQTKQSNQLSLPHQEDYKTRMDIK